ncbi:hypothetical protein E3Q12_03096 [Wallemia mellicola]|nr:hypothetical protein E3Q12_03096 [Wallemia mellicola]
MNKLDLEGILLLEIPLFRSPFQSLRKAFRNYQKLLENDLSTIGNQLNGELDDNRIDQLIKKAKLLRVKLVKFENLQSYAYSQLKARALHLQQTLLAGYQTGNDELIQQFKSIRIQRWLIDWSLRNNNFSLSELITHKLNIDSLIDTDLFKDISSIQSDLLNRSSTSALNWCNDNKTHLKKLNVQLDFYLRLQDYIELVRSRNIQQAIIYMRSHLTSHFSNHTKQIQQAAALLAFPEDSLVGIYRNLYNQSRWIDLSNMFRDVAFQLYGLSSYPMLHLALSVGLPSLKLPNCTQSQSKQVVKNEFEDLYNGTTFKSTNDENLLDNHSVNCPTCNTDLLGALAKQVPHSHHTNSSIVCKILGKVVKDGELLAFPNGRVYSKAALHDLAEKDPHSLVKCPRDGTTIHYSKLRKVFVS